MRVLIALVFILMTSEVFSGWDEVWDADMRGNTKLFVNELTELANEGDIEAKFLMSSLYRTGKKVERNWGKANDCLVMAAKNGHRDAQFILGSSYFTGDFNFPVNYGESFYWYRKSAEQGMANAQYHLAVMYHKGMGVEKNLVTAFAWMRAAESNYPEENESDSSQTIQHRKAFTQSIKELMQDMSHRELVLGESTAKEYMEKYSNHKSQ